MAKDNLLERTSLGREAARILKRMIVDGRFGPGERLVEDRLAESLGVSRTPLREALHRLEQEGLLRKRNRGGYELRPLDAAEVEDAVEMRALLEAHAAALAARRASPADRAALADNLRDFRRAGQAGDVARLIELNAGFHDLLRQAAGSRLLVRLLAEIEGVVERIVRALISIREAGHWSGEDHGRILAAIEAGDAETAGRLMAAHVRHGGEVIVAKMRSEDFTL